MSNDNPPARLIQASRLVTADPVVVFELIADPSRQPPWDGNDNLLSAAPGQRVHAVGDVFVMNLTNGGVRENHVVAFEEGRRIAWRPAEPGKEPPGHQWEWRLEPQADGSTLVTHVYDWTELTDESRFDKARSTTSEQLDASLARLAESAETG